VEVLKFGAPIVKYIEHSAVACAKRAEPIAMPFGLWTGVGWLEFNVPYQDKYGYSLSETWD